MSWETCASFWVETLSAVATTAAVFVALSANRKSNEQLRKALQMHRQTKDLALLERRMSLLEKIEQDKKISSAQFNLFFNAKLNRKAWEAMQEYHANMEELNYCATEEELFWISFEYDIAKGENPQMQKKNC